MHFALRSVLFAMVILPAGSAHGGPLSPENWAPDERATLEQLEQKSRPPANRLVEGEHGLVAGTMSPVANQAGLDVLKRGGTAADAAVAVALTEATMALGSFVSYAGIAQAVYFDAKTGRAHSLDAGWATYRGETEPHTIPRTKELGDGQGRKTLVPGFMAGMEALHRRFGVLPWADLLEPSIWYARHGVTVSPALATFFRGREKQLMRTEAGRRFLQQAGNQLPKAGDRFVQADLAARLESIAREGAGVMYTGEWARRCVEAIQREGGKATLEDYAAYQPIWQEPLSTTFSDHVVFGPGRSSEGGYQALAALNLIEALKIDQLPPYWKSPESLLQLSRVLNVTDVLPSWMLERAKRKGVELRPEDRASKAFAAKLAPLVNDFFAAPPPEPRPAHTAGVVVIDRAGNMVALVHSINTVNWGSTGIVVDGIPLSDPAASSQAEVAAFKPGERKRDSMVPMIATRDGRAAFGVAITGYAIRRETVRLLIGSLAHHTDLVALMTAPPLVVNNGSQNAEIILPDASYPPDFVEQLRALGPQVELISKQQAKALRGIGVIGQVDPRTNTRRGVEVTDLFGFATAY